jgi:hypothetical protein
MSTYTNLIHVDLLEEGDMITIDGEPTLVEDLYENGNMNGVWVCTSTGQNHFFAYDARVELVVTS